MIDDSITPRPHQAATAAPAQATLEADRYWDKKDVARFLNMGIRTIERIVKEEKSRFPKPVRLAGVNKLLWRSREIIRWAERGGR
jgi:predicted DNA-binding transcriptional regulator AlpA